MRRFLLLFLAVSLPFSSFPVAAKSPTKSKPSALQRDLAYYRHLAKARKMSPNDRLYILYRMKGKYAETKSDLAPLLGEIDRWETAKRTGKDPGAPKKSHPSKVAAKHPSASPVQASTTTPAKAAEPAVPSASMTEVSASTVTVQPVNMDALLQPGDFLTIKVFPTKDLNRETVVQPDGTIVFPLLGTLPVQGITQTSLEKTLVKKLRRYVTAPQVRVTVRRSSDNIVLVTGRVVNPGAVAYRTGMKTLSAVSSAGGFQEDADRSGVLVRRYRGKDQTTFTVDLRAVQMYCDSTKDSLLQPGDVVDVPREGNNVSIHGMVNHPGNYSFQKGITLLELLSDAGGFAVGAKTETVFLYRQGGSGRNSETVNVDRLLNKHPESDPVLKGGDIVMVPQKTFYAGTAAMTPWMYLATLVIAVVVATKN